MITFNFEEWVEKYDDDLWAEYHESGAYYEGTYDDWLDYMYGRYLDEAENDSQTRQDGVKS